MNNYFMVRIKTEKEIEYLRQGGTILGGLLRDLKAMVRPGTSTGELEAYAQERIAAAGGFPAFLGHPMPDGSKFPTAVCASINDEIVHGPALPARTLASGDIIGIDIGLEYPANARPVEADAPHGGYFTDAALTVIVGDAEPRIKELVAVTEECLMAAIAMVAPGNTLNDVGRAVETLARAHGFSVVRELVGHGVGHAVHEEPQVPNYVIRDKSLDNVVLKAGMVIAIEPMVNLGGSRISAGDDGFSFVTADGSLSAHFEHTVLVTGSGYEILTLV